MVVVTTDVLMEVDVVDVVVLMKSEQNELALALNAGEANIIKTALRLEYTAASDSELGRDHRGSQVSRLTLTLRYGVFQGLK